MSKRTVVALAAVTVLALPAVPASACSLPAPILEVSRSRLAAGESLRVSGDVQADKDGDVLDCMPPLPPSTPEPTVTPSGEMPIGPSAGPTETVEPSSDPSSTATTLPTLVVPVAYAAPAEVTITVTTEKDWQEQPVTTRRTIDSVVANAPTEVGGGEYRWTFAGSVTIPADLATGRWVIEASQPNGPYYGSAGVTVVEGLAATGSPAADLVRIGLLSLLAGGAALVAGRRRAAA